MASGPHPTATAATAASSAAPSAGGSSSGTTTTTTTTSGGILIGDRLYSEVSLTIDHSLIPEERLSPTPSMQDGLDLPSETDLRILGCELIQSAGILLRLPQVSASVPGRRARLYSPPYPLLHCISIPPCPSRVEGLLWLSSRGPSRSRSIPWVGAREAKLTSCSWWGRKGSEWRHKMAATPGAGPPDPALPFFSCLQVAMATGQVLFHRFFYSKSFVKHSFEVSRAGAGVKGFLHPEIGRRGVVLAASFSRKEAVSLGLCTYFSPTRKCGLLELRAVLETRKWIQTPQVSN